MNKKDVPLAVLRELEKFVAPKNEKIEVIKDSNFLFRAIDKDKNSDFYFNVEKYSIGSNDPVLLINYKPKSAKDNRVNKKSIELKELETRFTSWLNLLNAYDDVKSFFDDPIIKAYSDEYFSEFQLMDDDININPFNMQQVLCLEAHLEYIAKKIDKYKNEENKQQIEDIKSDIANLTNRLTIDTKNIVWRKVTIIWAKITKIGISAYKELIASFKKEFMTVLAKAAASTLLN
jgi:hypothetical protein